MAEIMAVVPEGGITYNERISFRFLLDANAPPETYKRPWGVLGRAKKSDDYIDIFRAVRGEENAVGDDGTPRWNINLFTGSDGLVFGGGVDSSDGEPGLRELLTNIPDCVALVPPEDIEPLTLACESLGHTLTTHRYDGSLATS